MKIKKKKLSTVFAAALAVIFILQSLIFLFSVRLSGIVKDIDAHAVEELTIQSEKSNYFIELEMLKKWADIDSAVDKANTVMGELLKEWDAGIGDIFTDNGLKNAYIDRMAAELLTTLRTNTVNGAFIVLCNSADIPSETDYGDYAGVYFKDADAYSNPGDYSDIVMDRGSSALSSKYRIPMDMKWSSSFVYSKKTKGKMDFFFKPVTAAHSKPGAFPVGYGYWEAVTSLKNDSNYYGQTHFCYSVPLIYAGQVYGVIGISVDKSRINDMFPEKAVSDEAHGGFAIVTYTSAENGKLRAEVSAAFGSTLRKSVTEGSMLTLEKCDDPGSLYTIKSALVSGEEAYCALKDLDLYSIYSPFYNTKWAILHISGKSELYGASKELKKKMNTVIFWSVIISVAAAVIISRLLAAPIKILCTDAKSASEITPSPERNSPIKELAELSSALHRFSSERNRAVIDLKAERERYLIALQTSRSFLFEYDCFEDIFTIYRFNRNDTQFENGRHHSYRNFRSLIIEGKVCPEEDIPTMLKFLDGEKEGTMKIRIFRKDGSIGWNLVKSKNIYDNDGRLARIVASSSDISKDVIEEQRRRDAERRDKISGFFKQEYGELLVEKAILENNHPYCIALISMTAADRYIGSFGAYSYDAVIEELGILLKRYFKPADIVWRVGYNKFAVYIPQHSNEELCCECEQFLDYMNNIYYAENGVIACHVGMSQNDAETPMKEAMLNAEKAARAAELPHYPNVVYYYNALSDAETMPYNEPSRLNYAEEINSGFAVTDNVVSYAINMLEKMKQLETAMHLIFCKMGHILKLRRIAWFEVNQDYFTLRAEVKWSEFGAEPVREYSLRLAKSEMNILSGLFLNNDSAKIDKEFYVSSNSIMELMTEFRGDGEAYLYPIFDKNLLIGFMAFADDENDKGDKAVWDIVDEIAKIVGAFILKSRTSIESRAKSDFLSRMSHEIRTPMNALMGMTAIALDEKELAQSTRDCLEKIDVSSRYLLSLINDILDMSRIESGKMTVENVCFSLEDTIKKIDAIMRTPVEAKGIYLKVEKNISDPNVMGDPLTLDQVIVNILGNAL